MPPKKVTLVVGAGGTLCEAERVSVRDRPPLDKRFFREMGTRRNNVSLLPFWDHVHRTYGIQSEAIPETEDSLESFTSRLYSAALMPDPLGAESFIAFRSLLRFFAGYLAETTNRLSGGRSSPIHKLLRHWMSLGVSPADISIVTFNQDIQIEKVIHDLSKIAKWQGRGLRCDFPAMYHVRFDNIIVGAQDALPSESDGECPSVFKLHGSLNWISTHNSQAASRQALFNPRRKIYYDHDRRTASSLDVSRSVRGRLTYGFPVIVPPVSQKGSLIPERVASLWPSAEAAVGAADEVVVLGYSCPEADREAADMLRRALRVTNATPREVCVIDPNPAIAARFADLGGRRHLQYFGGVGDYLEYFGATER